ncbi:MAG: hypothetical protein DRI71_01350 [Bacteroidetes bacterium]|nr:MAG: hypothetical protein DRI71_01350 [Bacteroidota bacterium]
MGKLIRWVGRTFNSKDNRCSEEEHCLELVRLMLDDESTEDDNAYVLRHIDGCYRCYDNFDVENAIREVVKQKSNNLKIPHEVVSEIREKIEVH